MAATPQMQSPLSIYLDASVMIDYCWENEARHTDAVRLIDLCSKYFQDIHVYVSKWTWVETHGRIYSKLLQTKDGITWEQEIRGHKWAYKDPRTYFPVKGERLQNAVETLEEKYDVLANICNFHTEDPDDDSYARVMLIVKELAMFGAIYPQDSLHLALSLRTGCMLFVSDDSDLLDRLSTAPCKKLVQEKLTESLYPLTAPDFEALPLKKHKKQRVISSFDIFTRLAKLGFT